MNIVELCANLEKELNLEPLHFQLKEEWSQYYNWLIVAVDCYNWLIDGRDPIRIDGYNDF